MEGVVRAYVAERRFGFIDGEDGKSYFFHADAFIDPDDKTALLDGAVLNFHPTATPKGLVAKRLTLVRDSAEVWELLDEFLVTRRDGPRWGEILVRGGPITVQGPGSPDDLRVQIRALAELMGANALFSLRYSKETGRRGNYRFTIHKFTACPALIMLRRATGNMSAAQASDQRRQELIGIFEQGDREYRAHLDWLVREKRRRARIWRTALVAVLAGVALLAFLGLISGGTGLVLGIVAAVIFAAWPIEPNPTWPRLVEVELGKSAQIAHS